MTGPRVDHHVTMCWSPTTLGQAGTFIDPVADLGVE